MERTEAGVPAEACSSARALARALPIHGFGTLTGFLLLARRPGDDLADVTTSFNASKKDTPSPFNTAGVMPKGSCGRPVRFHATRGPPSIWGTCSCRPQRSTTSTCWTLHPLSGQRAGCT